ncbi:hypothetical protein ACWEF9_20735 [Streptomyces sp. NPDC004980]
MTESDGQSFGFPPCEMVVKFTSHPARAFPCRAKGTNQGGCNEPKQCSDRRRRDRWTVHRHRAEEQLHKILTDKAFEVGVTIAYDKTFTTLTDGPDGVAVTYTDGSANTVDLAVGADGVYSKVRPYVLAEDLKPTYIGQSAFRLNVPREPEIDRIMDRRDGGDERRRPVRGHEGHRQDRPYPSRPDHEGGSNEAPQYCSD